MLTEKVKRILSYYESDTPGTKANLARILMHGRLAGSGRLLILPVDQGFEHGPDRSFAPNRESYDPWYHFELARSAGLSAFAAPLGMLESGAATFAAEIPLILKLNNATSLARSTSGPDQAVSASIDDALRLGCVGVGFTIYPGSDQMYEQFEELRALAARAKQVGLAVVVWSYPRGGPLSKEDETAIDIVSYAAHIAALLGAHLIKVKLPSAAIHDQGVKEIYQKRDFTLESLEQRVAHIMRSAFQGKRLVVFSGGVSKSREDLLQEVRAIRDGGGNGSIIGRNTFQRPYSEALELLSAISEIYLG